MATKQKKYFIRLNEDEFTKFESKAEEYGKTHPDLIRELITAVNEDRVVITPTDAQQRILNQNQGLYNVTRK